MSENSASVMAERTNMPNELMRGRKRSRDAEHQATAISKVPRADPDTRSFARGAIKRLRLHNFLTFDDVEVHPSPQLNVIVGPNGTGKSSIVCAICLGLGFHTRLLGRAKELKDFIKHGKQSGYVEIVLHNDTGKDRVIRRFMTVTDNSSSWTLDGKQVLAKDVTKVVEEMRIQLDNRCQFLPQDKVVDFAKMNAHELLEETEKAIGPKDMFQNHTKLKELVGKQGIHQTKLKQKREELDVEQRKNQLLERDVERFRHLQQYERACKQLRMKKTWVEYEVSREEFVEAKDARKEAEKTLRSIRHQYQPIKEKHRKQEELVTAFKEMEVEKSQKVRGIQSRIQSKLQTLGSLEDELEVPRQELESRKREEQQRRRKMETLRTEIQGFEGELEKLESPDDMKPKIAEKNARMRRIQQEVSEVTASQQRIAMERQQYEDTIRRADDELRQMSDVYKQRLGMLRQRDRETYEAIMWLQNNQHRFRQKIFEPIMLIVGIKDQQYSAQVEAFLSGKDAFSFVVQNREDGETFLREVRDRQGLRVNVVRAPDHPLSSYKPEIPMDVLRRYGFMKRMIDLIDAPEPVLCYFCQYLGLHHVPVAGNLSADQITKVLQELKGLRRFFTDKSNYSVIRSRYADKASVRNSDLNRPRFLQASVDNQTKAELERKIQEAKQSMGLYDDEYKELDSKSTALRQEDNQLRQEKNDLRKIFDSRKKIQSNIVSRKKKLDQIGQSSFDLKAEEERCEQAVEQIQKKRLDVVGQIQTLAEACVAAVCEKVIASKHSRTAQLKVDHLWSQFSQAKTALDNAEQGVTLAKSQEQSRKERAQQLLTTAQRVTGFKSPEESPELMNAFQEYPDDLDAIEELIHENQAQADMCRGTTEDVVFEFETRQKNIQKLKEEIDSLQADLSGHGATIEELKERWLGPLRKLIKGVSEKFTKFFQEMKCQGEVMLQESDDFNKYGVEIRVKFRDSEELQALNSQRQSGGERSVSTMLYLMALQEESSCPFRVVDEINQGMDPVNERRVFDLIVKTASEGAQYFLLTPKLLQGLTYSETVRVHMVCNGQELMRFQHWSVSKFLQ